MVLPKKVSGYSTNGDVSGQCFLVYTDIIADSVVGESSANFLEMVPMKYLNHETDYVPFHLSYKKVQVSMLSDISIMLRYLDGRPVEFDHTDSPLLVIQLHFRRRPITA